MKLELTQQEIQVVIMALGEVPLKISGPVFAKIDAQVKEQPVHLDHSDKPL